MTTNSNFRVKKGLEIQGTEGIKFSNNTVQTTAAPTALSQLTNDAGYAVGTIPTLTSQLTNDSGYITSALTNTNFSQADIGTIKLRDNAGILDAYTETVTQEAKIGTQLFLYNFNADTTDDTGNTTLTPSGESTVVDTYTQFGGGSFEIGTGVTNANYGAVSEVTSGILNIGLDDYTLEGWVYIPSEDWNGYNWAFMSMGGLIWALAGGTHLAYFNGSAYPTSTGSMSLDAWNHISWSRTGGNLYVGINGTVELLTTDSINLNFNSAIIGSDQFNNESIRGYVDAVRLVKGVALYTTNYTVPSAEPSISDNLNLPEIITTSTAFASVNPFNQSLNTGDNVQFNQVTFSDNNAQTIAFQGTGDIRFDGTWIKNVDAGDIYISPQDGQTWVYLPSDSNASNSALSINNSAGDGIVSINANSQVTLTANSKQLALNSDGSITLPANTSHITFDGANGDVVSMEGGDTVTFASFSGEILVNDLYNGYVYKFLVGGGYCTLIGHTNAAAVDTPETITVGPVNEACGITNWVDMSFTGDYVFTNLNYDVSRYYSFVTIRSRDGS